MTEAALQQSIMAHLALVLPSTIRAFHVPNGGHRNAATGARLKREGVKAGVPDIALVRAHGEIAFLEVKTRTGRLSSPQKDWADWCSINTVPYAVVRSIGDVDTALADFNIPVRGRAV